MTAEQLLLAATVSAAFLAGLVLALPSCLTCPLAEHLAASDRRARLLGVIFQFLLVPMMVGSGLLVDKWGPQPVLVVGVLLSALAIAAIEFTRLYRHALPVVFVLAAAGAALTTSCVVLMPAAILPHRVVASTNLGFIALTLGFLLGPRLATLLRARFGFRRSLQMLALMCLIPALPAVLTPTEAFNLPAPRAGTTDALADPRLWLAALLALLYQPLEGALTAWTPAYLKELGHPRATAPSLLWSFWGIFLAARLIAAMFVQPGFAPWFIPVLVLLAAITLGHLVSAYGPANAGAGLLLIGVCLGPLLPTIVGLVLQMFPGQWGTGVGVTLACTALGGLLLSPLIDSYARRNSARVAIRIPLGLTLMMMGAGLGLALVVSL
jgi:fucose permease